MFATSTLDRLRQLAVIIGVLFEIIAGLFLTNNAHYNTSYINTPIQPATYAFIVWAPLFLSALAYAIYQAFPSRREQPVLRRVGWFSAAAFALNGVLTLLSRFVAVREQTIINQGIVIAILVCAAAAYLRLGSPLNRQERWFVAVPLGLFAGWLTAATFVGVVQTLSALSILPGGAGGVLLITILLLVCAVVASALTLLGRGGPVEGYISYAIPVVWGLIGIAVNQRSYSIVITSAALIAALIVVAAAFVARMLRSWSSEGSSPFSNLFTRSR